MLAADAFESAADAFRGNAERFGNDVAASAIVLVNAVGQSPSNVPAPVSLANEWHKVADVLVGDFSQTWQAYVHLELVVQANYPQILLALLRDIDPLSNDSGNQSAASPSSELPVAQPNSPVGSDRAIPTTTHALKAPPTGAGTPPATGGHIRPAVMNPPGRNLLTNGGFETGDFTGWTEGGNTGYTEVWSGIGNNGSTYAAALGPIGSDGTLSQTVATTPGTDYQVSFDLESDGQVPNDFTATFDGQTLLTESDISASAYTTFIYDVQARSTSSTLQFSFRNDPGYLYLDDAYVGPPIGLITGKAVTLPFTEGAAPSQVQVASFQDIDLNTDPSQYSANIDWGDGQSSPGTIQYSSGQFQILGTNSYLDEGSYPIQISINDKDGASVTANATAAVSDAALTIGAVSNVEATAQEPYDGQFVSFSDANPNASIGDFTTQIDWGDGQTTPGMVVATGNGDFTLGGSHTYALPGTYVLNALIADVGGSQANASDTSTVAVNPNDPAAYDDSYSVIHDNTLTVSAANGVLANDTDPNSLPLTAMLVSGPSSGSLTLNSDGSFTYTPYAGYSGDDSFTYYASDGTYTSNTATVSLAVLSTINGQVWLDGNEDGLENNGEKGMSGVTVDLLDSTGVTLSSTTTDANGNYQLTTDPGTGGQFQIQVLIPAGYSATIPFASTTGVFSSIDASGYSNVFTLPSSDGSITINAGLAAGNGPLGSIGGEVWFDGNANGVLESGEPGLQSITVDLLDSNYNLVDSTSTDANGDYSFIGLSPNTPYIVQFVPPAGYAFSPQNVGPPATSSSAGPNGDTDPITLSPGQKDSTVNAGLNGDAPIVYDTNVTLEAENDIYTGIDFTADGYDPHNEPLTPIIVQKPTIGSVTYDTSTGLYVYTAPTNYTGLDSFQFELSNGHAVSEVVTVQVLAYIGILPLGTYDSFPDMEGDLYTSTPNVPLGDGPDPASVAQGKINDCWFVAAAAGEAQQNPNQIKSMLTDNNDGTYTVSYSGYGPVKFSFVLDNINGFTFSAANGDWLKALEKGYGRAIWNSHWVTWGNRPYDYINRANLRNVGIEALTGHSTTTNSFWCTRDSTTRTNLTNAFANKKVVVAGTGGSSLSADELKAMGLWPGHSYTVVAYDAANDQVRLRNPWGINKKFDNGSGMTFLGANTEPNNNGYFWMSLIQFTKTFGGIAYEQ